MTHDKAIDAAATALDVYVPGLYSPHALRGMAATIIAAYETALTDGSRVLLPNMDGNVTMEGRTITERKMPWCYSRWGDGYSIEDADGNQIADVFSSEDHDWIKDDEGERRAKLIAACPEIYVIMKELATHGASIETVSRAWEIIERIEK